MNPDTFAEVFQPPPIQRVAIETNEVSRVVHVFDPFDYAGDFERWVIEVQGLSCNGFFFPVLGVDGEGIMKDGLYLPFFKIVCRGHLYQSPPAQQLVGRPKITPGLCLNINDMFTESSPLSPTRQRVVIETNDVSRIVHVFDPFEYAGDFERWVIEIQGLSVRGYFSPIIHIEGEKLMKENLYLPFFKIVCRGHLLKSEEYPRP